MFFNLAIVFSRKPHFDVKRMYCINVRLGGEHRENLLCAIVVCWLELNWFIVGSNFGLSKPENFEGCLALLVKFFTIIDKL